MRGDFRGCLLAGEFVAARWDRGEERFVWEFFAQPDRERRRGNRRLPERPIQSAGGYAFQQPPTAKRPRHSRRLYHETMVPRQQMDRLLPQYTLPTPT